MTAQLSAVGYLALNEHSRLVAHEKQGVTKKQFAQDVIGLVSACAVRVLEARPA